MYSGNVTLAICQLLGMFELATLKTSMVGVERGNCLFMPSQTFVRDCL